MSYLIGYARVSTQEQNLDAQVAQLEAAGCHTIYKEKASGKTARERTQLGEMLRSLRPGDTVVVTQLDRLSRSLTDIWSLANQIESKKAQLRSLNEPFDTSKSVRETSISKLIFNLCSLFAEFERNRIIERTRAGLETARANGRIGGRPRKLNETKVREALRMRREGQSMRNIAAMFDVSPMTIKRAILRHECSAGHSNAKKKI